MKPTIVVIGGGPAGMSVAFELLERAKSRPSGFEVVCLESSDRPGGNVRTERENGFTLEWGPNGFLDNSPPTLDLVKRLGMEDRLLPSDQSSAKRFIFRAGRLRQLPSGAGSFLTSDVLTWGGKFRVFLEPFQKAKRDEVEESVYSFAARRIGEESARVMVGAMVAGIYAGDAKNTSLQAAFPKMFRMEHDHGGLVKAMLAKMREKKKDASGGGPAGPGGHLTSFKNGFQELMDGLAKALGPSLRLNARPTRIDDMGVRGYRVHLAEGAPIDASAVVLSCPAWHAAPMVSGFDAELGTALTGIPSGSLAVVHLGYANADLPKPLDGFGYLIPRGEGLRSIGTLWSSCIFPGHRAPDGMSLVTVMIGGANDPEAVTLPEGKLLDQVFADLEVAMGLSAKPRFVKVFRHERGIPQYTIGHMARLATIDRRLAQHPCLLVCGNSYRGISVNAVIAEAPKIADAALGK
jgi:oxygen-dependent protoporphyrinogen oxidase